MIHTRGNFRFESEIRIEWIENCVIPSRKCLRVVDGLLNRKLAN